MLEKIINKDENKNFQEIALLQQLNDLQDELINLKKDTELNKRIDAESSYQLLLHINDMQDKYSDLEKKYNILKLKNDNLLKELDYLLEQYKLYQSFCDDQTAEIERAYHLIKNMKS